MTTFFTSDLHVGHRNIIRYCDRPYADADEMNQALLDHWNATVRSADDLVWLLGDLAIDSRWQLGLEVARQLRGRIRLVTGNHDRAWVGRSDCWRYLPAYAAVFEAVTPWARTTVGGTAVLLSHFPYAGDSQRDERYDAYRLRPGSTPVVHGHVHSRDRLTWATGTDGTPVRQVHVGVDAWDYRPVAEPDLVPLLED